MSFDLSEEFEANVGMYQGCVLSLFLCSCVDVLSEFLYADDLLLMSEAVM